MCRSATVRRTSARISGTRALATLGFAVMTLMVLGLGVPTASASGAAASAAATASGSLMGASIVTAPQGGTITISGNVSVSTACPAGMSVQLTSAPATGTTNLFTDGLGPKVPRDASGNFQSTFVIPLSTPVGSYTIGLLCGTSVVGSTETLNVTAGTHAKPTIAVSPATAPPGATVTFTGIVPTSGTVFCPSGDATQLTSNAALFPPNGFGPQVTRDAAGNFKATYQIPAATASGNYTVGARCGGGNVGVSTTLSVMSAAATTTTAPVTTTTAAPGATVTTIPAVTATTIAPATTVSPTTVPAKSTKSKDSNRYLRWVALGVLALVVIAVAATVASHRRGGATGV